MVGHVWSISSINLPNREENWNLSGCISSLVIPVPLVWWLERPGATSLAPRDPSPLWQDAMEDFPTTYLLSGSTPEVTLSQQHYLVKYAFVTWPGNSTVSSVKITWTANTEIYSGLLRHALGKQENSGTPRTAWVSLVAGWEGPSVPAKYTVKSNRPQRTLSPKTPLCLPPCE